MSADLFFRESIAGQLTAGQPAVNLTPMSKMSSALTADEMAATKSTLTADGYRKIGRTLYRWNAGGEMWSALDASALRFIAARKASEAMVNAARTMPWHQFVCHYVATETAREPASGYTVRGSGDSWEFCFMGSPQFAPMSASSLYSWLERTMPLQRLSRAADTFRGEVLSRKAA